jgi:multiple sugar transport system substrate-binding protein
MTGLAMPASQAADTINIISLYKTSGGPEAEAMKLLISKFEAASGAKVNFTEAGEGLATQYNSDLLAGKGADLMIVNLFDGTSAWLENGASVPVDGYVKQWGLDKVIQADALADWSAKTGSGAIQGFPFAGFTWPIWYNKSLLAKAGIKSVPQTTDQLITAAKALRAKGIAPIVVGGSDWSGNKLWSQIIESYMPPAEAKKVFANGGYCSSKNAMKGIDLFVKLRDAGVFVNGIEGYTADQMNTAYYTGKAAIMPAGSGIDWDMVVFKGLTIKGVYGREIFETWYKGTMMVQSGLPLEKIITHRFPYTDFKEGFDIMRSGKSGKIILNWEN